MAGRGHLGGLRDPVAGLVARVNTAAEGLAQARAEEAARAEAQARAERQAAERAQAEAEAAAALAAQREWLGQALDQPSLDRLAHLYGRPEGGGVALPVPGVAALILDHARRAVALRPDLEPLAAIQATLDRRLDQGATGTLPRAGPGDGPTLAQRLKGR